MDETFANQHSFITIPPSPNNTVFPSYPSRSSTICTTQKNIPNLSIPDRIVGISELASSFRENAVTPASAENGSPLAMAMASSNDNATPAITTANYLDLPSALSSSSPIPELVQSARSTYSPPNAGVLSFQCKDTPHIDNALTELTVTQAALITSTLSYAPTAQQQQLMSHSAPMPIKHNTSAVYTSGMPSTNPHSSDYVNLHGLPSQNTTPIATTTAEGQHWPQVSASFHLPTKNVAVTSPQHQLMSPHPHPHPHPPTTAATTPAPIPMQAYSLLKKSSQGHATPMNSMAASLPQIDIVSSMNELNRSMPDGYHQTLPMQTTPMHYDYTQLSLYPMQYKTSTMMPSSSSSSSSSFSPSLSSNSAIPQLLPMSMTLTSSQQSYSNSEMSSHDVNGAYQHGQLFDALTASTGTRQDNQGAINYFGNPHSTYSSAYSYGNQVEIGHSNIDSLQSRSASAMTPVSLEDSSSLDNFIAHIHAIPIDASAGEAPTYHCKWRGCTKIFPDPALLMHHASEEHIGRRALGHLNLRCEWDDCEVTARKRDHIISHIRLHIPYWPLACKLCGRMFKRNPALKRHLRRHMEKPYTI